VEEIQNRTTLILVVDMLQIKRPTVSDWEGGKIVSSN